jgi:hypothetical protein
MSDARWSDVDSSIDAAMTHFAMAVQIYEAGGLDELDLAGYTRRAALMHAVDAGYTSLESAMMRILGIAEEEPPTGRDWHSMLISRMSRALTGEHARPALFGEETARDLSETMRFRHRARHSAYDDFEPCAQSQQSLPFGVS